MCAWSILLPSCADLLNQGSARGWGKSPFVSAVQKPWWAALATEVDPSKHAGCKDCAVQGSNNKNKRFAQCIGLITIKVRVHVWRWGECG